MKATKPTCARCGGYLTTEEILTAVYWNTVIFGNKTTAEGLCEKCDRI